MDQDTTVIALDMHKASVEVAILPPTAVRPTERTTIANRPHSIERLYRRVTRNGQKVVFVYEAGPCGYEAHKQITGLGGRCVVIAPSAEHGSGSRERRGSITKAGNAHIRRILVEAAWSYRRRNTTSPDLAARRRGCRPEVVRIARKAQDRPHRKFWRLVSRGKPSQVAAVAVARELAGFVWAIAQHVPATGGN